MPRRTPSGRSYARPTRHERQAIERMLDGGRGRLEIAGKLDRAPSTVANEVQRHRFVTSPRALRGEPAPAAKLDAIRDGLRRGLSPEQIAATRPDLGLSASTIYRWVGGACPQDPSRRPGTNPTPAETAVGGPLRDLPTVSLTAETRYSVRTFRRGWKSTQSNRSKMTSWSNCLNCTPPPKNRCS